MVLPDTQRHAEEMTKIRKERLIEERGKIGDSETDPNKIQAVLKEEDEKRYKQLAQLFPTVIHGSSQYFFPSKQTD